MKPTFLHPPGLQPGLIADPADGVAVGAAAPGAAGTVPATARSAPASPRSDTDAAALAAAPADGTAPGAPPLPEPEPPTPAERQQAALARLQFSRAQLRAELIPPSERWDDEEARASGSPLPKLRFLWRRWSRRLGLSPLVEAASHAAESWWQAHPWRPTTQMVAGELKSQALPLVRRHPWAAVTLAAAAGAGLTLARPWIQRPLSREARRAAATAKHWAIAQLTSVPVQSMLLAAFANWATRGRSPSEPVPPVAPAGQPSATATPRASAAAQPPA